MTEQEEKTQARLFDLEEEKRAASVAGPRFSPPPAPTGLTFRMSGTIAKLAASMAKAQAKIELAEKDRDNPFFRSQYATLASVWEACRLPLAENGIAVMQIPTYHKASESVGIETMVMHESGEWLAGVLTMPVSKMVVDKESNEKAITAQAVGSAISYGQRYSLKTMLMVPSAEDDDDGNAASGKGPGGASGEPFPVGPFDTVVKAVRAEQRTAKGTGKPYTQFTIALGNHGPATTISAIIGKTAQTLAGTGQVVSATVEVGKFGPQVVALKASEKAVAEAVQQKEDDLPF